MMLYTFLKIFKAYSMFIRTYIAYMWLYDYYVTIARYVLNFQYTVQY